MDWTYRLRLRHLQVLLSLASTGNLSQSQSTPYPTLSKPTAVASIPHGNHSTQVVAQ